MIGLERARGHFGIREPSQAGRYEIRHGAVLLRSLVELKNGQGCRENQENEKPEAIRDPALSLRHRSDP